MGWSESDGVYTVGLRGRFAPNMVQITDEVLLQRWVRQRDAEAFAEIVARYSGMVHATCRRVLGDPTEAEDTVQDCFLRLSLAEGWSGHSLAPWLHRLATYRSLDRLRSSKRRRLREIRYSQAAVSAARASWDDIEPHVDRAIAELPENLRELVVRHFLRGESYSDMAEATGLSRSTVARRVQEGVAQVRETLTKRGFTANDAAFLAALAPYAHMPVPATLVSSLGKMAMAGGAVHAAASAGAAGVMVMTKKAAIAIACVLLSAGGYLGYRQWTSAPPPASGEPARQSPKPNDGIRDAGATSGAPKKQAPSQGKALSPEAEASLDNYLRAVLNRQSGVSSAHKLDAIKSGDLPEDNGAHFFLLAVELLPVIDTEWLMNFLDEVEQSGWRDDPKAIQLLRDCQASLNAIRTGLQLGNASLPPARGWNEPLPHLAKFRNISRISMLESCMYSAMGDYARAQDSYATALSFSADSTRGGPLVGHLVGCAMQSIAFDFRDTAIQASVSSPDQSAAFIATIQAIEAGRTTIAQTVATEAGDLATWFQESIPNAEALVAFMEESGLTGEKDVREFLAQTSPEDLYALTTSALADYEALAPLLDQPYYGLARQSDALQRSNNPISNYIVPDVLKFAEMEARSTAQLDGLALSCAIESYARHNGSYPPSLAALSPGYFTQVPSDPFTGKPYQYSVTGSGFSLYSLGPDMADGNGAIMDNESGIGDIVLNP